MAVFQPTSGERRTRGQQCYVRSDRAGPAGPPRGLPCSVRQLDANSVILLSIGPELVGDVRPERCFWEYLCTWGGSWMWESIVNEGCDLNWVVTALRDGTAILVTDGSYKVDLAPTVSGAGWVLYCTSSKLRLRGSFYEVSPHADSYPAEYLGLLAIHTLLAALQEYHEFIAARVRLCCDNQSALYKSRYPQGPPRRTFSGPSASGTSR